MELRKYVLFITVLSSNLQADQVGVETILSGRSFSVRLTLCKAGISWASLFRGACIPSRQGQHRVP